MRTIIAGSRSIIKYNILLDALGHVDWPITTIISGTAPGADQLGERFAKENDIPLEYFPADWETYGKRAGYLRNVEMAKAARACIVLWDGESKGAGIMARLAKRHKLPLLMYRVGASGAIGIDRWKPARQLSIL